MSLSGSTISMADRDVGTTARAPGRRDPSDDHNEKLAADEPSNAHSLAANDESELIYRESSVSKWRLTVLIAG